MPEGDTIFRMAAQLRDALAGKRLAALQIRRDPRGRRGPEPGTAVDGVDANGKHLLMRFSDGHVLHTHMQLTGAWHVYAPGERWRRPGHTARVVLRVDDGTEAVCFAAPIVELRRDREARTRPTRASRMLEHLGPDLCGRDVDLDEVVQRLASRPGDTTIAAALLDQQIAAGVGNVFKSEVCWAERVWPFTPIAGLDAGRRRAIYETAHTQLAANLGSGRRTTFRNGLAVYRRAGRPCPRCRTPVVSRRDDAGRSTFWCPRCQPEPTP